MKYKILILIIPVFCCFSLGFAQSKVHWFLKTGLHCSNFYYHTLPTPESGVSVFLNGDTVYTTGYGSGSFQYRWRNSFLAVCEKDIKEWLSMGVGIGYRQRGYQRDSFVYRGQLLNKHIEANLHYISSELLFKIKPIRNWYFLLSSRFDILANKQSSPEHQYIMDNLKGWEASPVVSLGREFRIKRLIAIVEFEVNRGLMNISTFAKPPLSNSETKAWNMGYGFNLGLRL